MLMHFRSNERAKVSYELQQWPLILINIISINIKLYCRTASLDRNYILQTWRHNSTRVDNNRSTCTSLKPTLITVKLIILCNLSFTS